MSELILGLAGKDEAGKDVLVPVAVSAAGTLLVSAGAVASDGVVLDLDSLAQTLSYNADGTLAYEQVVCAGHNYRRSYAYTSGQMTAVSAWVLQ